MPISLDRRFEVRTEDEEKLKYVNTLLLSWSESQQFNSMYGKYCYRDFVLPYEGGDWLELEDLGEFMFGADDNRGVFGCVSDAVYTDNRTLIAGYGYSQWDMTHVLNHVQKKVEVDAWTSSIVDQDGLLGDCRWWRNGKTKEPWDFIVEDNPAFIGAMKEAISEHSELPMNDIFQFLSWDGTFAVGESDDAWGDDWITEEYWELRETMSGLFKRIPIDSLIPK